MLRGAMKRLILLLLGLAVISVIVVITPFHPCVARAMEQHARSGHATGLHDNHGAETHVPGETVGLAGREHRKPRQGESCALRQAAAPIRLLA